MTAQEYVGTTSISGEIQLELLKKEGLTSESSVLEIGCGCLHLGLPLIQFLDVGKYVGIDPNEWLRKNVLEESIMKNKKVVLLNIDDFNVIELGRTFDFIFSHSILSHCADWQLDQFLGNLKNVLSPDGKILSSIRLAEGNSFGSEGSADKKDSNDTEWQYPGVSWFTIETIKRKAELFNLDVTVIPEYTDFYTNKRPTECHDWLLFKNK